MKRMTKITAIAILCLLTNQGTQAGWLSNMGQRIVQSAVNTVEGNIKRKVNNTVNDTMDGKLGKLRNTGENTSKSTSKNPDTSTLATSEQTEYQTYEVAENHIIQGKMVYYKMLEMKKERLDVDVNLSKGTYLLELSGDSYISYVSVSAPTCTGDCTITMLEKADSNMISAKDTKGFYYMVEVKSLGNVRLTMTNSPDLMGGGSVLIYQTPGRPATF